MAAFRSKMPPVGSAQWLLNENQQTNQLIEQEVEEYSYSVRDEMEWLNEHMAEIFSCDQVSVTDIFKTPGRLRGKTPRTVRKRNPLETRAPLTDVFAPNPNPGLSPSHQTQFYRQVVPFQVAEDPEPQEQVAPQPVRPAPQKLSTGPGKENTDSGYHGITDDEMEFSTQPMPIEIYESPHKCSPVKEVVGSCSPQPPAEPAKAVEERRETEESFVSAEEVLQNKASKETCIDDDGSTVPDEELHQPISEISKIETDEQIEGPKSPQRRIPAETTPALDCSTKQTEELQENMDVDPVDTIDADGAQTPSDSSSPARPLVRKSSLTFPSLPPREPLTTKKSMGTRISRTSQLDQYKSFGRFTGGKSLGGSQYITAPPEQDKHEEDLETDGLPSALTLEESETTKLHNKTSTQRLHERINMLGQSKEPRPSKSIPSSGSVSQTTSQSNPHPVYPQLPLFADEEPQASEESVVPPTKDTPVPGAFTPSSDDEDDDWIQPVESAVAPFTRPALVKSYTADVMEDIGSKTSAGGLNAEPKNSQPAPSLKSASPFRFGHKKAASSSVIPSPLKAPSAPGGVSSNTVSKSQPQLSLTKESTTPVGSPTAKKNDGPLSASKAKLYSVFKSAKGIFASSAAASAQGKMEALSPAAKPRNQNQNPALANLFEKPTAPPLYPELKSATPEGRVGEEKPPSSLTPKGRQTRSSTEREREAKKERDAKDQQRSESRLEKAREREQQRATASRTKPTPKEQLARSQKAKEKVVSKQSPDVEAASNSSDPALANEAPPSSMPKSLLATSQVPKPRETRRLAKATKETLPKAKPVPIKVGVASMASQRMGHPQMTNAALSASLQDSLAPPSIGTKASASSLRSAASNTSLKTATGANSIKGKGTESALRRNEKEDKAAQRRRELEQKRAAKLEEERRAAEQRAQDAKRAAPRHHTEVRKAEPSKPQAVRPASRQANNLAHALSQEKTHAPPAHSRADLGGARPLSRMNTVPEITRPIPPVNPAKPPKRAFNPDREEEQPSRPAIQRTGPSFQQLDAKRRKTLDEDEDDGDARRSVMAPPIRHSNIRKEPNKFPHGYMPAPPPASHNTSLMKTTLNTQQQLHNSKLAHGQDMSKFSSAKIPFAEQSSSASSASAHPSFKTPARPNQLAASTAAKSSPRYTPGENIALPEIATDSEDEDSDNDFQAPQWVNSPALKELLSQQQLIDPQTVFGPIAPLQMEEIFKNKDRHKRFRDRTSSANWNGSDRLTEDERIKDKERRERLIKEGGWSYDQTQS